MLKAAMAAPSACNQQPWEFYVVKDKAVIGRLSEASPYAKCAKDAPVVFVPCFRSKGIADRKSTRLNSSHVKRSRMPSSA